MEAWDLRTCRSTATSFSGIVEPFSRSGSVCEVALEGSSLSFGIDMLTLQDSAEAFTLRWCGPQVDLTDASGFPCTVLD